MDVKALDETATAVLVRNAAESRGYGSVEAFVLDVVMDAARPAEASPPRTARSQDEFDAAMEKICELAVRAGTHVDDSRDSIDLDPDELG